MATSGRGRARGAVHDVAEFVEKPDAARAKTLVASGDYLWNSGMFLLPAKAYLDELGRLDSVDARGLPQGVRCRRA